MEPALYDGDRVVTYNFGGIKRGSVIVFKYKKTIYVKRVDKVIDDKVFVSGDNKKLSSKVEPISKEQIIGRVVLRYSSSLER